MNKPHGSPLTDLLGLPTASLSPAQVFSGPGSLPFSQFRGLLGFSLLKDPCSASQVRRSGTQGSSTARHACCTPLRLSGGLV